MNQPRFSPLSPKIVLGIAAHPDDLDFGAAGSMAKYAKNGTQVYYLIITDGSKGSEDPAITSKELVKIREAEQRKAIEVVGGKEAYFLGYPDGELEITMQLKKEVVKIIRTVKPDVVITMDPKILYSANRGIINHPDHRVAGQAALDAVYPLARDHLSFPELLAAGFKPHKTPDVLLITFDEGNYYEDISDTFDDKVKAITAHTSQISDSEQVRKWLDDHSREQGQKAGFTRAESFVRIHLH